jgi:hypothetical protein
MAEQKWSPDDIWYKMVDGEYQGVLRARQALKNAGVEIGSEIISSKDEKIMAAQDELKGLNMPDGIDKWQLPVVVGGSRPVYFFITVGTPNAVVPAHVHDDDNIWRLIVSGSIIFRDVELKQGDWLYIPKGKGYTYTVGAMGCIILHTYH